MFNKKIALVFVLVAALSLSGCFGIFSTDVAKLNISTENDIKKIAIGQSVSFTAKALDKDDKEVNVDVSWSVSDDTLGSLDINKGKTVEFTASEKAGTVEITVKAGDKTATYELEIIAESLNELEITSEYSKLIPKQSLALSANGKSESGLPMVVDPVWTLSNETVGRIDENNNFVASASGSVTLTAKVGDIAETFEIEVYDPVVEGVYGIDYEVAINNEPAGREVDKTDNIRNGYRGIRFWNTAGTALDWKIDVPSDGKYIFFVKYSSHTKSDIVKRDIDIRIGDADPYISHEAVDFQGAGNFGTDHWNTIIFDPYELQAETNVVRLTVVATDNAEEGLNVAQLGFIEIQDGTMPISKEMADELVTAVLPPHESI